MDVAAIESRLTRFRVTRDPEDLWPGLSEQRLVSGTAALADTCATLLRSPHAATELRPPEEVPARLLGVVAYVSGTGPLLGHWIEAGRLDAPSELRKVLGAHLLHGRLRWARLRLALEELLTGLAETGVQATLLKGAHLANAYYPEPGARPMADLDVLVEPTDAAAAARVLRQMGLRQTSTVTHATTWSGDETIASLEVEHAENPWRIDLHTRLDRRIGAGPVVVFGLDEEDVAPWRDMTPVARVLRQPLLTWYLAVHIAAHFMSVPLSRLIDLALVLRSDADEESWRELTARLESAGSFHTAYPALSLLDRFVPDLVPGDLLERLRTGTPERILRIVERTSPSNAQRLHRQSLDVHLIWASSPLQSLRWQLQRVWPRDASGPLSPGRAARVTVGRLRRLLTGRLRWRS